jgi:hypothetical protein
MPKRRAVSVDSDSESEQPQLPKRARTNDDDAQTLIARSRGRSRRTVGEEADRDNSGAEDANNKDELIEIDDDEEEEIKGDAPLNAADEIKFEELNEESVRHRLMNAQKIQGVGHALYL